MSYDFETRVDRRGLGSLKLITCPAPILDAGLFSYAGAEMEFHTAPSVMEAVIARAKAGAPSYTLCDQPYRDAVTWWMGTQRGLNIEDHWIIPTHGTIYSLATTIRMATEPGEAIIVQPPVYNRYEQAAQRLGRKTLYNRLVRHGNEYRMDLEDLEGLMASPEAKLFVLCNPHNPTGNVWGAEDLAEISRMAAKYGVIVYSDEIFAEVALGARCPSFLEVPGAPPHAIVATGLGKAFSFTGVNHANVLVGDAALAGRFRQQRTADHYGSIDPWAYSSVLGAYCPQGAAWKDAMVAVIRENVRYTEDFFKWHLPQVKVTPCQGTYVMWFDWSGLGLTEEQLKLFLEREALLDLSPGAEYSADGPCMTRMCIAVPRRDLERSLELLRKAAAARNLAAD